MSSNLPAHGIRAVVEGLPAFQKAMDTMQKEIDKVTKTAAGAGKGVAPVNDALEKTKGLALAAGSGLAVVAAALVAVAAAAVAAGIAIGKAFLDLAERGAPLQEIGRAFDNITASVGVNSQKLLKGLQEASEGTVSNFDLIKTASTALIGTTGQLGQSLGQTLPQFLSIAKVQADATGKSVNELFNNLVEGVKRGTPKLIESTGLIIDQKAAYQAYAETLGITVAQLSDTDRSMALLGETLDAGAKSIETLGSVQESNADKLDRINASTTNILDGIALSLQPIFGTILDSVQRIINGLATFAPYVAAIFQFVGGIISKIVGGIADAFSDPDLAKNMFEGAAATFGSFANGIIKTANEVIFPAIIDIATFIANFLVGNSPPKEGPLSQIDKGGANLMTAWLGGISGVSLDPVTQVAAEVSKALGAIGKQGLIQVNARLAQLDKSLLPFQNRLDIIKAQFEALNEPAKAALDAIDRQAAELQEKVLAGDPAAAERLRMLDLQRDAIQGQVDAQQALVDRAQIQLALANAQQAPERSLLTIRKAYLDAWAKAHPAEAAAGGAAPEKAKKEKAGAAPIDATAPGGGGIQTSGLPGVNDLLGGQDAIDAAKAGMVKAFEGEIDAGALDKLGLNSAALSKQLGRINGDAIGANITKQLKPFTDAFDPSVAGSVANNIFQFFNGPPENEKSLAGIIDGIGKSFNIDNATAKIKAEFAWIIDPEAEGSPANIFATLTGDASVEGSVASFLANLPNVITTALSDLTQTVFNAFNGVIGFLSGTGPGTLSGYIDVVVTFFKELPSRIVDALRGIGASVYSALAVPVIQAINGLIGLVEKGVSGLINEIANFVGSISDALGEASPQVLKETVANLHGAAKGVKFGRISTDLPAFLQAPTAPAAAAGGIFGKGFMTVGERGTELMYNASKMGVVPHELTSILMSLQSILAQPQPMMMPAGNTSNTSSSSYTFNGVQSDNDARRRYNTLRAGMR